MTDDPLQRYGTLLRDELRGAAGPPPPLQELQRRHNARRTAGTLGVLAAVAIAIVALPQLLGVWPGPIIDPLGPGDASDPPEDDGREDGSSEPAISVDVQPLDLDTAASLRLVAVRFNDPSLAILDLEAGVRSVYPPGAHPLPRDAIGGGLVLSDDTVAFWQDGTVRIFRDGLDREPLVHTPSELINPPEAAPSLRVVPTADETALWVVQIGFCCPDAIDGTAELVDLATGEVTATAQLPPSSFPVAATGSGLLFDTHRSIDAGDAGWVEEPGSERILHVDHDGAVADFAPGGVFAVSGDTVLVRTCGPGALRRDCDLEAIDTVSGDRRSIARPVDGEWTTVNGAWVPGDHAPWNATAPDGRILAAVATWSPDGQKPAEMRLVAIDPDTGTAIAVDGYDGPPAPAAWDRTGTSIVLVDGHDLILLDPADGTTETLRDVIPEDHYLIATG